MLKLMEIICGVKYKVEGVENIPKEPFIIASKHLSAWETIFFAYYFKLPVFIFKRILMAIPVFGWYMYLTGMVGIKRGGGSAVIKQVQEASIDVIQKQKRVLIIFPQGTRTRLNSEYSLSKYPYKKGIIGITEVLKNTPIMCTTHDAVKFFGRGFLDFKTAGTVTVKFLPPIKRLETDGLSFLKQVETIIETETQKLF